MGAKTIAIAMLVAVLASMIGVVPALADDASQPDLEPAPIGNQIRAGHFEVLDAPAGAELGRRSEGVEYVPGDTNLWLALDSYCGYYYWKWFELKAVGEYAS